MKKRIGKLFCALLVAHCVLAYADDDLCHTQVILKNKIADPANQLTVNLENQGKISWEPVWNQVNFSLLQSTQSTMTYPKRVGEAPQSNALFTVQDGKGGSCSFAPWIIVNCDVIFDWNCNADAHFVPKFFHLKRLAQKGPWIIEFIKQ